MEATSLIVIGAINTDIIATGLKEFPKPNDPVYEGELVIGPGGKSSNIASMAGYLLPSNSVAMISRTVQDPYGLWKQPMLGLEKAGVNTEYIKVLDSGQTRHFPSVALVGVDAEGNNMCFILPGVSKEFSKDDIDEAVALFEAVANNNGIFALSLECPLPTAQYATNKAVKLGMRVALDPGGIMLNMDISGLLALRPYLIKPNEYEAKIITGVEITDMESAQRAAGKLKKLGAQNVLITHGKHGAYLFGEAEETHIPIPDFDNGLVRDATGCGDQTMAALCAYLHIGKPLREAAQIAVLAGTMQFHRSGIQPLGRQEIDAQL